MMPGSIVTSDDDPARTMEAVVAAPDLLFKDGDIFVRWRKNHAGGIKVLPVPGHTKPGPVSIVGYRRVCQKESSIRNAGDAAIFDPEIFVIPFAVQLKSGIHKSNPILAGKKPQVGDGREISLPTIFEFPRVSGIEIRILFIHIEYLWFPITQKGNPHPPGLRLRPFGDPHQKTHASLVPENPGIQKAFDHHPLSGWPDIPGLEQGIFRKTGCEVWHGGFVSWWPRRTAGGRSACGGFAPHGGG